MEPKKKVTLDVPMDLYLRITRIAHQEARPISYQILWMLVRVVTATENELGLPPLTSAPKPDINKWGGVLIDPPGR